MLKTCQKENNLINQQLKVLGLFGWEMCVSVCENGSTIIVSSTKEEQQENGNQFARWYTFAWTVRYFLLSCYQTRASLGQGSFIFCVYTWKCFDHEGCEARAMSAAQYIYSYS